MTLKSFVWLTTVALGLALVEVSSLPPSPRGAASFDIGDRGSQSDFLAQFLNAGSLSSGPTEEASSSEKTSPREESQESKEPIIKSSYGGDSGRHSSHGKGGYDSYDDGYDSYDDGYDSYDYGYDDHHGGYSTHHKEKDEEPYFQAALDCRFRVYPYVTKPQECSEVKVKDYEPDFLFDSPSKKEAKGYCYWDFHRAKVDPGGACLCPRPKKECKDKKKQCFWHTYPNIGKLHDDKDKKGGYYGSKHDKHKDKSSGVCIHNSERFYNLMAKLLAKRGKKDLSLQIHYSSAPARGKLPYGPHGPAIIGYGKDFEQRHGPGYKPEYYREEHYGYDDDLHGYGDNHYGFRDPYSYGVPETVYGGEHLYLPPNPVHSFQHGAPHYTPTLPSYDQHVYPSHGYEKNEYGFEPHPIIDYNHPSAYDYATPHETRWPMSGYQVDPYFLEPEVEHGSYHSEPYDWLPTPWTMAPMYDQYLPMNHYMPSHHQCPTPYASGAAQKTDGYSAVQHPQSYGYAAPQHPQGNGYATLAHPPKTDSYATVQPVHGYAPAPTTYDTPAPSPTYQQQTQTYSAPPAPAQQYKAPAPSHHQDHGYSATPYQPQGHNLYPQPKPDQVYQSSSSYASSSPPRYAHKSSHPTL